MTACLDDRVGDMIAAHRAGWLRDAADIVMALDAGGGRLHAFDFNDLPDTPQCGYLGFTAGAQLHELAADYLPHDGHTYTAAVAVATDRVVGTIDSTLPNDVLIGKAAAAIAAIVAHEHAHNLDAAARGYRLPEGTTLEDVIASMTDGRVAASRRKAHGPGWLRAYWHMVFRASRRPHHDVWIKQFILDIEAALPHPAAAYVAALDHDILAHSRRASLGEVLSTPAPIAFVELFDDTPKEPKS